MRGLPGRPEAAGVSEPRGGDASLLCAGPSVLRMDGGGAGADAGRPVGRLWCRPGERWRQGGGWPGP